MYKFILALIFANFNLFGQIDIKFKKHIFNDNQFIFEKIEGYNFHSESNVKNIPASKLLQTNNLNSNVGFRTIELLIPDKIKTNPLIHIYSYDALDGVQASVNDFMEYKNYLKTLYKNDYNVALSEILKDTTFILKNRNQSQQLLLHSILKDNDNELSKLNIIEGEFDNEKRNFITLTQYILNRQTIIIINYNMVYYNMNDINQILKISNQFIKTFYKNNSYETN